MPRTGWPARLSLCSWRGASPSAAMPYSARPESLVAEPSAMSWAAQTIAMAAPPKPLPSTLVTSVAKKPTGLAAMALSPTAAGKIVVDRPTTTTISSAELRRARATSVFGFLYSGVKVAAISVP